MLLGKWDIHVWEEETRLSSITLDKTQLCSQDWNLYTEAIRLLDEIIVGTLHCIRIEKDFLEKSPEALTIKGV